MSGDFPEDWFRPGPPEEGDGDDPQTADDTLPDEPVPPEPPTEAEAASSAGSPEPAPESSPAPDSPDSPEATWELKESAPVPVLTSARAARTVDLDDFLPSPERRAVMQRRLWLFLVSVVALALVAGLAGGTLVRRALDIRLTPTTATATPTTTSNGTALQPWNGGTADLRATTASATCTAPAGVDGSGHYVSYDPANTVDGQLSTAWRCDGDALNAVLEFTFADGVELVGVGIVNGYAKGTGATSLYDQYRRVTSVRWDLSDGSFFMQNLSENSRSVQQLMIPPTQINGPVRLTILASTAPGQRAEPSRDAVLLSTVRFLTKD